MPDEITEVATTENTAIETVVDEVVEISPDGDQPIVDDSVLAEEKAEGEAQEEQTGSEDEPTQGILKVKVDGEEISYDLTNEDTLTEIAKLVSHASAANKRMQEATQMQQQSVEFIKLLQTNPIEVLTDERLGINFREVAENYLLEQLDLDNMDDGSRENYTKARQYERMMAQQEYQETQDAASATEQLAVQIKTEIENGIMESGMPLNELTFEQVRAIMFASAQKGTEITANDAVHVLQDSFKSIMTNSKDEDLIKVLGEDNVKRVAKTAPKENVVKPEDQGQKRESAKEPKKKMTVSEWRRSIGI